jgi:hypothetical protein
MKIKTRIKAGLAGMNHSETLARLAEGDPEPSVRNDKGILRDSFETSREGLY